MWYLSQNVFFVGPPSCCHWCNYCSWPPPFGWCLWGRRMGSPMTTRSFVTALHHTCVRKSVTRVSLFSNKSSALAPAPYTYSTPLSICAPTHRLCVCMSAGVLEIIRENMSSFQSSLGSWNSWNAKGVDCWIPDREGQITWWLPRGNERKQSLLNWTNKVPSLRPTGSSLLKMLETFHE